eukprot:TRINITY_DN10315_c0_g1_i1.p1 TRINITY_DN10315_c0_g1~~TRINITY_DN10315_c0_g1_i1.p1  ORF type:complete len:542 (+),score=70.94 TRINITY_DN10315_c0_g1_i1:81-1706(+)
MADESTLSGSRFPWRVFTDYEVKQTVVIRSPELRIPELLLFVALILAVFVYDLGYKLHAVEVQPVSVETLLELRPPQRNFWSCKVAVGNCILGYPSNSPSYCSSDMQGDRCKSLTTADLQPEGQIPSQDMAIVLSETFIEEDKCAENNASCYGWEPRHGSKKDYFTKDPESNLAVIRTNLIADSKTESEDAWHSTGSQVQSLIRFRKSGEVKRLIPFVHNGKDEDRSIPYREFFEARYQNRCGEGDGHAGSCMGTPFGDFIGLDVLLKAANYTLTKENRRLGFVLMLNIVFTNCDPQDFWTWPFGFKPKVVYEPRVQAFSQEDFMQFEVTENTTHDRQTHKFRHVVLIKTSHEGYHARFSLSFLVSQLAIASTILGVSHLIVREVLVLVYKYTKSFKHVGLLFDVATRKVTPHVSQFADVEDAEELFTSLEGGSPRGGWSHPHSKADGGKVRKMTQDAAAFKKLDAEAVLASLEDDSPRREWTDPHRESSEDRLQEPQKTESNSTLMQFMPMLLCSRTPRHDSTTLEEDTKGSYRDLEASI